jgi:hypothetical protein
MSTAKFDTLQNVAGTKSVPVSTVVDGSAKAWVNFNGTGTVAIRASFNVSSITDNGTGNYTVNFTTALTDANFATTGTAHDVSNTSKPRFVGSYAKATSSCSIAVSYQDGLLIDATNVEIAIFR